MIDLSHTRRQALAAVSGRRSVRGFLDRPIPPEALQEILATAARASSGNNTLPWRIHVLTGSTKSRLTEAILAERAPSAPEPDFEYQYYPKVWPEPYLGRRRAVGWDLYHLLGIEKRDRLGARRWQDRSFAFFGAPVGLILTVDRRLGLGALIDLGMFLEAAAIAARAFGLDTCPEAAFGAYHRIVRDVLGLAPEEMVICGMAIGVEDRDAAPNRSRITRVPVVDSQFSRLAKARRTTMAKTVADQMVETLVAAVSSVFTGSLGTASTALPKPCAATAALNGCTCGTRKLPRLRPVADAHVAGALAVAAGQSIGSPIASRTG